MSFVLLMAGREIRASWRRLLFFFVCVAIGVGAIVALRSMIQNIRTGLSREARALIGGDVAIATNRSWTPEIRGALEKRLADVPIIARQETVEVATMVRPEQGQGAPVARMVELRGVQPGFPFYGVIGLEDGRPFTHDLLAGHGALVRPELLAQLGLRLGDRLIVGGVPFTIRGVISQEPGRRVGAFSFGSRVLVDYDDLMRTGLLSFGSRANYQILLKMNGDPQPLVRDLRQRFRDQVRQRAVVSIDRGSDRRRSAAGGELSEPGRVRDPRPRRHRSVERDPGLRSPEDQERRDSQVPGRDDTTGPRGIRAPGRFTRAGRERAWGHARTSRDCFDTGSGGRGTWREAATG